MGNQLAPRDTVTPLVEPRPPLLPLRDSNFTWQSFQRLCGVIPRAIEGYVNVHEYGRPGQDQGGLDWVATGPGQPTSVYQARDIAELTARGLRCAVEDYVAERRFGATRFVLCVGCVANDTRVIEELERLREKHAPLRIDLYDAARISDMLRARSEIVAEFFGPQLAAQFCVGTTATPRLDADALLRGPLRALNLAAALDEATTLTASNPQAAAKAFELIARRLEHRYPQQSESVRVRVASALRAAGDAAGAFDTLFSLAIAELWDRAEPRRSPTLAHDMAELAQALDTARRARHDVLIGWERWHEDAAARSTLGDAAARLRAAGDAFAERATVLFVEACLADDDTEGVRARESEIRALAASLERPEQLRLRVALADALGPEEWSSLYAMADGRELAPGDAAYVAKRAGRWQAWAGRFDDAEQAYRRAIELASEARLDADAADALWALVALYASYDVHSDRLFLANEMALSLDGGASYVPRNRRTREHWLRELARGDHAPEAHMWMRHARWEALASGSLADEQESLKDLGRLYQRTGFGENALRVYIRGGADKLAAELAGQAPAWIDVVGDADAAAPWVRRAALETIAAQGELVPDATAHDLLPIIERALTSTSRQLAPVAAHLAAAIAWQLEVDDARRLGEAFRPLAPREPGRYHFTDRGMLAFAARSYDKHAELRPELAMLIAACAVGSTYDSDLVRAVRVCGSAPAPLVERLLENARAGHLTAVVLLAALDQDLPAVHEHEQQRLQRVVELPTGPRSEFKLLTDFAIAPVVLARTEPTLRQRYSDRLLDIARDDHDLATNRASALEALAQAARSLPVEERQRYFPSVLELIGAVAISRLEQQQAAANHPLSRFRLHLGGPNEIRSAALECAVELATSTEEREEVAIAASELMRVAEIARGMTGALVRLTRNGLHLDADDLARSSEPALRAVAAVIWCDAPHNADFGRRLAKDEAPFVRAQIAHGLSRISDSAPDLANELRTQLARDARASIRWLARPGTQ